MNVFIVEKTAVTRQALQFLLSDMPDVTLVSFAVDEPDAIKRIKALLPDVVILDLSLQAESVIGVLENIKKHHATIKFIVLTYYADEFNFDRCKRAGVDYFIDKSFLVMQLREILLKLAHPGRLDSRHCPGN